MVTGGAGFIGSHVADRFLEAGHEVAVLDNLTTGSSQNLNPAATLYDVDVRDREGVAAAFDDFKPDVVDHHAAQSEVPKSVADPVFDAEVNVAGGVNLLKASKDHGVRKFVFISTGGALYGEPARDLLYVSDAATANLAALDAGSGEAYNIGTGVAVSVNEIFERLREITGYKRPPLRGPRREGDVRRIAIDCAKAERDLGW